MWEIPEAQTIAGQWNKLMAGKTIGKVEAGKSPHKFAFYFDDPANYDDMLKGKTVGEAKAYGGQVEIEVQDNMRMLFGEGAIMRYLDDMKDLPDKYQMALWFTDGSGFYCTVGMYGMMYAFPEGANDDNIYYMVAKEKINPLEEAFDWAYFKAMVDTSSEKLSAKAFLATEQRIPGLGNGVLQDILYEAKINPMTKLKDLDEADLKRMYDSMKSLLKRMTELGGRDVEKDLYGNPGGYVTQLSKNTYKMPCKKCGSTIIKKPYLGGSIYYCPECQPVIK